MVSPFPLSLSAMAPRSFPFNPLSCYSLEQGRMVNSWQSLIWSSCTRATALQTSQSTDAVAALPGASPDQILHKKFPPRPMAPTAPWISPSQGACLGAGMAAPPNSFWPWDVSPQTFGLLCLTVHGLCDSSPYSSLIWGPQIHQIDVTLFQP